MKHKITNQLFPILLRLFLLMVLFGLFQPADLQAQPLTIGCPLLIIDPPFPDELAVVNQPFTKQMRVAGGVAPYAFQLNSGPTGLAVSAAGVVSWTPPTVGQFQYTVTVFDSGIDPADEQITCDLEIVNPIVPVCPSPIARQGQLYSQTVTATGGIPPFGFQILAAPAELTLTGTTLSGTFNTPGIRTYTLRAARLGLPPGDTACQIDVRSPLSILCPVPDATVGLPYVGILGVGGGFPTSAGYTLSLVSGPPNLNLNSATLTVTFTPPTVAVFQYTIRIQDSGPAPNTADFTCTIDARLPLSLACPTLLTGRVGALYTGQLITTGGPSVAFAFALVSTTLPGLTVSSTGLVNATPTAAGTFSFTAQVTNAPTATSITCELDIRALPQILCPVPNAISGSPYSRTLAVSGGFPAYTFTRISGPAGLEVASGGLVTFTPPSPAAFDYVVQVTDSGPAPNTSQATCQVIVRAPLALVCPSATVARTGQTYTGQLGAAGGFDPYQFALTGAVPGVSVSPAGVVTFASTTAATVRYTASVTDSGDPSTTATGECSIVVAGPPQLLCPAISAVQLGSWYSADLNVTGGLSPFTFNLVSSTAPGTTLTGRNVSFLANRSGTISYTASVTDAGSSPSGIPPASSSATCEVTVDPRPINLFCGLGTPGRVGFPLTRQFLAEGGLPPFTWSLAGNIPGMTFDAATGVLSGTPTSTGNFQVQLSVEDSFQQTSSVACTVTVENVPLRTDASCGSLPLARVGGAYNGSLQVSGGTGPYYWQLTSGSIPGLTLSPTGSITGQPSTAGEFPFTATVRDSGGQFQQTQAVSCRIFVNENFTPLNASCGTMPQGRQGELFTAQFQATGGREPYLWSLAPNSDQVPGLAFTPAGILSGRAETSGAFRVIARVRDSGTGEQAQEKEINCGVSVEPRPGGMSLSCGTLTSVRAGEPFPPFALPVTGGEGPYTFSVIRGSLPPGLAIQNGSIVGTPAERGFYGFTVEARDSAAQLQQSSTAACSLNVRPQLLAAACGTLPDGSVGRFYTTRLNATGGISPFNWTLEPGSTLPPGLNLAGDGQIFGFPEVVTDSAQTFNLRVTDSGGGDLQQTFGPTACSLTIPAGNRPRPSVTVTPTPTQFPTQLARFSIALAESIPESIQAVATLTFVPNASNTAAATSDVALRFGAQPACPSLSQTTVCRTMNFVIPPGTTQVILPADGAIVQGTMAGTITVNVAFPPERNPNIQTPAIPPQTLVVRRLPPVIESVELRALTGGFEVEIIGYSTTRNLTRADITLTLQEGSESFQVPLESEANQWFNGDGRDTGGQFRVRIPFEFGGVASAEIRSVQVTLANSEGSTTAPPATFR